MMNQRPIQGGGQLVCPTGTQSFESRFRDLTQVPEHTGCFWKSSLETCTASIKLSRVPDSQTATQIDWGEGMRAESMTRVE